MFNSILYRGPNSPLSNSFPVEIDCHGQLFRSAQHAYQHAYLKYTQHGWKPECDEVCHNMQLGGKCIHNSADVHEAWESNKQRVMKNILILKFGCCLEYRQRILCNDEFIEDSDDLYWSRGPKRNGCNMMGMLHKEIKQACLKVLIAGSSHVRGLDSLLQRMGSQYGKILSADLLCLPGARTHELKTEMMKCNMRKYKVIIIVIGSNDLYSKEGMLQMSAQELIEAINSMMCCVSRRTAAKILLNPVLPRTRSTGKKSLSCSHFIKQNRKISFINRHLMFCMPQNHFWIGDKANEKYLSSDGVHMNLQGKEMLVRCWLQGIY